MQERTDRSNKPIVAIVGRPNVGKSTLFNRLMGQRRAIVSDIAGTTRDRVIAETEWAEKPFLLVDTGGLDLFPKTELWNQVRDQIYYAIDKTPLTTQMLPQLISLKGLEITEG